MGYGPKEFRPTLHSTIRFAELDPNSSIHQAEYEEVYYHSQETSVMRTGVT
ncbi:MAG: hypothetical protein ACE5EO_12155 [Candidatus Krumholzibacteriia bacterium]